jgi:hypothetical protein
MTRRSPSRRLAVLASEALAIGLGVFLSLWADEWRENRGTAVEARESLARLAENLATDSVVFADLSFEASRGTEAIRTVLQADPTDSETSDLIAEATPGVLGSWILVPSGQEYEALRSSGRLGLIKDSEVLSALANYYQTQEYLSGLVRLDVDQAQAVARLMYPHVEFPRDVFLGPASYPVPTAAPSVVRLLSDRVYVNEMTYLGFLRELVASAAQSQVVATTDLLDMIRPLLAR